ncbi:TRAP transporter small permease subunit [Rhodoplanes elegans]|uniref:TRAP transporter small permease subunit n=1 Tax=Rhodoplanes elegans TaxID=29408 RepID=UPI0014743E86|nr:TRAP transporter small permease subunit [Rhodoplanes elegans]
MTALLGLSRLIDAVNARLGRALSWLILAAILVSAVNAVVRKVFGLSANAWLELQWVLFGAVFLMCAPWTLLDNEHIRIDIVNTRFSRGVRNAIELIGHALFLLPLCVVMMVTSWPFFVKSAPSWGQVGAALAAFPVAFSGPPDAWLRGLITWWTQLIGVGEQSSNAGGLPQWPAKFLVFAGFTALFVQGLSELIKRIAVIVGRIPDPHGGPGGHLSSFEADAEDMAEKSGRAKR